MEYELWLFDIKQCNKLVQVTCGGMLMHFFSKAEDITLFVQ